MPLSPELVLMFLGGMWVGFWVCFLRAWCCWVGGVWFVNSGREHLVAIREVKLALAGCACASFVVGVCGWWGCSWSCVLAVVSL